MARRRMVHVSPSLSSVLYAVFVVVMLGTTAAFVYAASTREPPTPRHEALPPGIEQSPIGSEADRETVVVVIGDSFTGGSDMNRGPVWAEQLAEKNGWVLVNLGIGGSGYLVAGQGTPFEDRVNETIHDYAADLVILAGGHNDLLEHPVPPIAAEAANEVRQLHDRLPGTDVVVMSPFASGTATAAQRALGAALKRVADKGDAYYIDALDMLPPGVIGVDGTHPTDEGHRILAQKIGAALKRLHLPRANAYKE